MNRYRRLRINETIRAGLEEVSLKIDQLIFPLFITEGKNKKQEIKSMPGIYQITTDLVVSEIKDLIDQGLKNYIIFGIPDKKDFTGSEASNPDGPVSSSLNVLKQEFGDNINLFADVCLCEYTDHGHCGIPDENGNIQNDISLDYLSQAALVYAEAGADWVAPSNMMDYRVKSIREKLDKNGFDNTLILSYSSKFASNYYGPFRDAAYSSPSYGDRKSYQINYKNPKQAKLEVLSDIEQGADAVMVKPALAYLDIVHAIRQETNLPLFTYNVSGEYSMVKFGAKNGLFNEKNIALENLFAMRRAGADMILTYHAADLVRNEWL